MNTPKQALYVTAILFSLTSASCTSRMRDRTQYDAETYQGDGRMIDHGETAAMERFNLHLGKADFSKKRTLAFQMRNLPPVRFWIGFDLRDMPPLLPTSSDHQDFNLASVYIVLKTAEGETILEDASPLSDWTWSGNMHGTRRFVYLRGQLGVENDEGSSFVPGPHQQYLLTVTITPLPGSKAIKPAELRMSGGGWKTL